MNECPICSKEIQKREADLVIQTLFDFRELDILKDQVTPHKDFYELAIEWDTFKNNIESQIVSQMNPEEIKSKHKSLFDRSRKQ